jgi:hypothetical protein
MFRHPKYYKELRKRNKEARVNDHSASISDQAISSCSNSTELAQRSPGPGLKLQAREDSTANSTRGQVAEPQASSVKHQAPEGTSDKRQAQSSKRQA